MNSPITLLDAILSKLPETQKEYDYHEALSALENSQSFRDPQAKEELLKKYLELTRGGLGKNKNIGSFAWLTEQVEQMQHTKALNTLKSIGTVDDFSYFMGKNGVTAGEKLTPTDSCIPVWLELTPWAVCKWLVFGSLLHSQSLSTLSNPFGGGMLCLRDKPETLDPKRLLFITSLRKDKADLMVIPDYIQFDSHPIGWHITPDKTQGFPYEAYVVYNKDVFCSKLLLVDGCPL